MNDSLQKKTKQNKNRQPNEQKKREKSIPKSKNVCLNHLKIPNETKNNTVDVMNVIYHQNEGREASTIWPYLISIKLFNHKNKVNACVLYPWWIKDVKIVQKVCVLYICVFVRERERERKREEETKERNNEQNLNTAQTDKKRDWATTNKIRQLVSTKLRTK